MPTTTNQPTHASPNPLTCPGSPPSQVHASLAPINATNAAVGNGRVSLLKTAIATVCHDQTQCETNILFDEGAQRSFITQSLANQLGVCYTERESIALSSFRRHSTSQRQLPVTSITIITLSGEQIPIQVLVIEQIATPLQNRVRQQLEFIPHLKGFQLAHPVTSDDSFSISLLIGADHYWVIVKDNVIRGKGPTAVASKLGYLISGPLHTHNVYATAVNLLQTLSSTRETEHDLQRFWSLESLGISPPSETDEDKSFLHHY